ncbi:MAG: hypothetical protein QOD77_517 [Thermoplasmata archaeon]|jgi:apolipoprotein N-acyltransferase|nr:hypothetical protein [Thermoplasmata archaeon]
MAGLVSTLLANLFLSFAVMLLVAGLFGAYYGKGRSRSIGVAVAILAGVLIGLFCALTWPLVPGLERVFDPQLVLTSMAAVGGALLGALVAGGLYVLIVVRN